MQNDCFCILIERYFMKLSLLCCFIFLFSCKHPTSKNITEDSFESLVNIDTNTYKETTKEFLKQRFPPQNKTAFVLNGMLSPLTGGDIKTLQSDTIDFTRNDADAIQFLAKNAVLKKWSSNDLPDYKVVPNDSIQSTIATGSKFVSINDTVKSIIATEGWLLFYKKYGYEFHFFSAPIFLKDYSYCIFRDVFIGGMMKSSWELCLYKKINGKWTLVKTYYYMIG